MSLWKKLFGGSTALTPSPATLATTSSPAAPLVKFEREERREHPAALQVQITKKIYSAQSREAAVVFLRKQNVSEPFFYIEVDTPSGRFGIDNGGRVYDNRGNFIEAEPKPEKVSYDTETLKMKTDLENAMQNGRRQTPPEILSRGEDSLRCLRIIIEDASADFYLRRMALWWGGQFNSSAFNTFIDQRFVDGKDRVNLYQKAESSQSDIARAEEGLYVAAVDMLNGKCEKGRSIEDEYRIANRNLQLLGKEPIVVPPGTTDRGKLMPIVDAYRKLMYDFPATAEALTQSRKVMPQISRHIAELKPRMKA